MSIEGFESQVRYVNESLDLLDDMIEVGAQIDDCFDEFQVLKGEIKKVNKRSRRNHRGNKQLIGGTNEKN